MTPDDVVEAMARAMFMRGWVVPGGMASDDLFALRKRTDPKVWRMHIDNTLAALRALHERGALVVGRMPDNKRGDDDLSAYQQGVEVGWNNALLKVRAAAVVAEPPADG